MTLDRDEMKEILEHIARNGSDSSRIQAIRELRRLEAGGNADEDKLEELIAQD